MPLASWLLVVSAFIQQPAPPPPAAGPTLDYEFFKQRVEPIFLYRREGHARCYVCHRGSGTGNSYLQVLSPGATMWDEAQSQKNFQSVKRFVVPGKPDASRLLKHPLKEEAGGDEFHGGGKHWTSKTDPEWQMLSAWVNGATLTNATR
ncbi:MAG TPA: hypothetical protein VGZ27_13645 [Vicinamibacterales bacterium]|jgi:hypothetical protein|nr:hypothetical protein [Vicinamibacterales bacterium]